MENLIKLDDLGVPLEHTQNDPLLQQFFVWEFLNLLGGVPGDAWGMLEFS